MGSFIHARELQGQSKSVTHSQKEIVILSECPPPSLVGEDLIAHCGTQMDAVRLCIHLSNFSHDTICRSLGIDNGHWTRMMQGRAHFPPDKLDDLMCLSGNLAPLQYMARRRGYRLPGDAKGLKTMEAA